MWRGVLELLFPGACARCGRAVGPEALCPGCRRQLLRLAPGFETAAPPPLESWVAAVSFEGEAAAWLRRFKYPDPGLFGLDPAAEAVAAALIGEAGRRAPGAAPELIVPVPLHPRRLRERGFNPAGLLAAALGRDRARPVDPAALTRIRDTPSQTRLPRERRARNVSGAFRARQRALPERIWLVDDVVTTGSTLREAARTLRRAGAQRIVAVCAARTPELR
jgi:ComF family protein